RFAQGLHEWAAREESVEVNPPATAPQPQRWSAGWSLFATQRLAVRWGVALAALIFLVAAGILLFQNLRLRQQLREAQARRDELSQSEQQLQEALQAQLARERQRSEPELAKPGT